METYEKVRFDTLDKGIPLVAQPVSGKMGLSDWLKSNRPLVDDRLERCGAILFRGFEVASQAAFEEVVNVITPEPLEYIYRSTPRTQVGDRIYTATEYPPSQSIPLHNESSYQRSWPMRLMFFCLQPAEIGGETPLADSLKVTRRIDVGVRRKFSERGVRYVRNYETGLDLSWQTVFQTTDKYEVERYCVVNDIQYQWKNHDSLRTEQVSQGLALHPSRGEQIWFNQAHLFHISSLGEPARKAMLQIYRDEELPRNAYYGDGSPIEGATLDHIRDVYRSETVVFHWATGDLLLLDNMLVAHARNPYKGKRAVLVAMGDEYGGGQGRAWFTGS
jgi:alpha-ketoglutarate-dependent taurine dioxygenase